MKANNKDKIIALAGTLLFHGALLLIVLLTVLMPPKLPEKPLTSDLDESEILLGSEYVIAGDVDAVTSNEQLAQTANTAPEVSSTDSRPGTDLSDGGAAGEPTPVLTSKQPSSMKVTPQPTPSPDKAGASKPDKSQQKPANKVSQETATTISNRVSFNNKNSGDATGKTGSPDGNAEVGATSGKPGYSLAGRSLEHWVVPSGKSAAVGQIVITVKVKRDGTISSAVFKSASPSSLAADMNARRNCINAALKSRFSVKEDAPVEQQGTITYKYR